MASGRMPIIAAPPPRPIYFLHVSKSGGTSLCKLAESNGCRVPKEKHGANCFVAATDRPLWLMPAHVADGHDARMRSHMRTIGGDLAAPRRQNCSERAAHAAEHGYTFSLNEQTHKGRLPAWTPVLTEAWEAPGRTRATAGTYAPTRGNPASARHQGLKR